MALRSGRAFLGRADAPVARRDLLGRERVDGATLEAALAEVGAALPPGLAGQDIRTVRVFGCVSELGCRGIVRDCES